MKSYLCTFVVLLSTSILFSQDQKQKENLLVWTGTIDGIHGINLQLEVEDEKCSGSYTLLSSDQKFHLEGNIENGKYVLQEIDQNLRISGNLNIDIENLSGIWSHPEQNIFLRIALSPSNKKNKVEFSDNNWHKQYFGVIDDTNLRVDISKENNTDLKVNLNFDGIYIEGITECIDPNCQRFLVAADELSHLYKSLDFKNIGKDKVLLYVHYTNNQYKAVTLKLDNELSYECQSFANYQGRFDIIYPKLNNDFFNKYITQKLSELCNLWTIEEANQENNLPENRFKYNVSLWTDILYQSDTYISGILTKQDNWSPKNERVAFTIDLKNNKEINIESFFKKPRNLGQKKKKFLSAQKRHLHSFQEDGIKDWIKDQKFEFMNITKKGILMTSAFSNIYGERQLVMSYDEIKDLLRRDFKKEMDLD